MQTTRTFRIFVSSTFADLKEERNALQKDVFPRLKKLCRENGIEYDAASGYFSLRTTAAGCTGCGYRLGRLIDASMQGAVLTDRA